MTEREMTWLHLFLLSLLQTVPIATQKPADKGPGKGRMYGSARRGMEGRGVGLRANRPSWLAHSLIQGTVIS